MLILFMLLTMLIFLMKMKILKLMIMVMLSFTDGRFTSFKQYINHLLSKACAAAKKEVF